jgi:hypothetical protein
MQVLVDVSYGRTPTSFIAVLEAVECRRTCVSNTYMRK